jgi:hypothetical protein
MLWGPIPIWVVLRAAGMKKSTQDRSTVKSSGTPLSLWVWITSGSVMSAPNLKNGLLVLKFPADSGLTKRRIQHKRSFKNKGWTRQGFAMNVAPQVLDWLTRYEWSPPPYDDRGMIATTPDGIRIRLQSPSWDCGGKKSIRSDFSVKSGGMRRRKAWQIRGNLPTRSNSN